MNTTKIVTVAVGLFSLVVGLTASAATESSFAFGPLEQMNSRSVTVLGQTYALTRTSAVSTQLTVGAFVLVEAATDRKGASVVRSIKVAKAPYVPGATDVGLSGVVTNYDSSNGVLTIGGLAIYAVDALVAESAKLAAGLQVEIVGRQANPLGLLWASEIRVSAQSIEGTGRTAQSIEGTGVSAQSIEGTGRKVQSIEGTGVSAQSIEGTGRKVQSIEGTGVSAQSIEGTGRKVQSIEGTGVSAQSIEGTGRKVQSIEGTGVSAQSIEGTGRKAQSIEGTGVSAQSIEGTGRAPS